MIAENKRLTKLNEEKNDEMSISKNLFRIKIYKCKIPATPLKSKLILYHF